MDGICSRLEALGFKGEASAFSGLLGPKEKEVIAVPVFHDSFPSFHSNESDLVKKVLSRRRLSQYCLRLLSKDEIDQISGSILRSSRKMTEIPWKTIIESIPMQKRQIFSPQILSAFIQSGQIFNSDSYVNFIRHVTRMQSAVCKLLAFDLSITDSVSDTTLAKFIESSIAHSKSLSDLESAEPSYKESYISFALNQFSFLLSPIPPDRFDLYYLVNSHLFAQFVLMDVIPMFQNPFSIKEFSKVYDEYSRADTNGDGLLSKSDIKTICGHVLCSAFVDRIFEVMSITEGTVDFVQFLCIRSCIDHIEAPQSAEFFFRALDCDGDGMIGLNDIDFFYKSLVADSGIHVGPKEVFLSGLLDYSSSSINGISWEDFKKDGNHQEIVQRLADVQTFKEWEGAEEESEEEEGAEEESKDEERSF